jgi:diaminopimelate decarboxylase
MSFFTRRKGVLHVEDLPLSDIAERFGTPTYVYSRAALTAAFNAYKDALAGRDALVCYAVKANSNLAILNVFARLGAGFDIVSGGELARVIAAGGDPAKVVFSGVGKSATEMRAALEAGIRCFNVESAAELDQLNSVAADLGKKAPVSLRVNPNVDPKTHPYISTGLKSNKFGVAFEDARALYRRAASLPNIAIHGLDCHIGSQLLDPAPAAEAAEKILGLADELAADGIHLSHLDFGGGMGIQYSDEVVPSASEYLAAILKLTAGRKEKLLFEPGRSLVGNAGILLTRVEVLKPGSEKNFAIIDAAMNDLMRPALYDAYHAIVPVVERNSASQCWEVVGPVCESGDFLGHARELAIDSGDLLAILSAGAYGMTMSSNYNTRPRAAEILVDGTQMHVARQREEISQLFALEAVLPG